MVAKKRRFICLFVLCIYGRNTTHIIISYVWRIYIYFGKPANRLFAVLSEYIYIYNDMIELLLHARRGLWSSSSMQELSVK